MLRTWLCLTAMAPSLFGTIVLDETFTYPDGDLIGAPGSPWTAHSGAGNGPVQILSGTLELRDDRSEDVSALLAGAPFPADGTATALYAGFTLRVLELPSTAGSYFAHFRNTGGSFRGRAWISRTDAADGYFRLGIGNSTGASAGSGPWAEDLVPDTDYRVVIRYEIAVGLTTLWVDPMAETDPGVTANDSVGLIPVSNFSFRQSGGIGVLRIEDLIVGDAFDEVAGAEMTLAIDRVGLEVSVSWPASMEGAVLQSATNLVTPQWTTVPVLPVLESGRQVVRFATGITPRFFRLRQP